MNGATNTMTDGYGRCIDYMRISVTDRCNLRCIYCTPSQGIAPYSQHKILRYEEVVKVVRVAARAGIRKVRLTGGEPLTRKDLPHLVESISRIEGIKDIAITTNGTLLKGRVRDLASAGLKRINISLDSMRPERFEKIRRGGRIDDVLEGMHEAETAGLLPIKINMVPIRGMNDDEIEELAALTLSTPYHVRFIELMPMGSTGFWTRERCIPTAEVMDRVSSVAPLIPTVMHRSGPARCYQLEGAQGFVGFISPITQHFCRSCNRIRLTSDGKLRPCLFSEVEIDLRAALRSGAPEPEIGRLIAHAVSLKPWKHSVVSEGPLDRFKPMSKIGG